MLSANFKPKRTAAALRCFLATTRLSFYYHYYYYSPPAQSQQAEDIVVKAE